MKQYDMLIKNGTIVTTTDMVKADLAVKNGKIAAIGQNLAEDDATVVYDVEGKLVLPGALDVHTHLAMPFGGTVSSDSYFSGTRAAACGGVTTIFDYPVQKTGDTIIGLVNSKKEMLEKEACVDYAMHCCITNLNDGAILEEMEEAVAQGITSFKCFLVY
ncbi:MAG: dihydropyrimidinase, partial [Eubacterium sp.]